MGFTGGSVVKNLPANTGYTVNPWSRKIPRATEQLSLGATAIEPVLKTLGTATTEPLSHNTEARGPQSLCSATREAPPTTPQPQNSTQSLQLERSPSRKKEPAQPKINKWKKFIYLFVCLYKNTQIMTCWTRRHKVGWQVTPSASRYPFWGHENPRIILIESTVSTYSHKGRKVTRFIASTSQKWGQGPNELGEGRLPLEPELEVRVASTGYLQTGCDGGNRLFSGSTLSGYFK